jgi:hypothetical protein
VQRGGRELLLALEQTNELLRARAELEEAGEDNEPVEHAAVIDLGLRQRGGGRGCRRAGEAKGRERVE